MTRLVENAAGRLVPAEINGAEAVPYKGVGKHQPTAKTSKGEQTRNRILEAALELSTTRRDRFRLQHLLTLTFASQGRSSDRRGTMASKCSIATTVAPRACAERQKRSGAAW